MASGQPAQSIDQIIKAAQSFKPSRDKATRSRSYKSSKRAIWNAMLRSGKKPSCKWCGVDFTSISDATADHIIPLDKGGSNGMDNLTLACEDCNRKRANFVTNDELKRLKK